MVLFVQLFTLRWFMNGEIFFMSAISVRPVHGWSCQLIQLAWRVRIEPCLIQSAISDSYFFLRGVVPRSLLRSMYYEIQWSMEYSGKYQFIPVMCYTVFDINVYTRNTDTVHHIYTDVNIDMYCPAHRHLSQQQFIYHTCNSFPGSITGLSFCPYISHIRREMHPQKRIWLPVRIFSSARRSLYEIIVSWSSF